MDGVSGLSRGKSAPLERSPFDKRYIANNVPIRKNKVFGKIETL